MARCCTSCFRDLVLIAFLEANGTADACEFCKSTALCMEANKVGDYFSRFLDYYAPFDQDEHGAFAEAFRYAGHQFEARISEHIQRDWNTFSERLDEGKQRALTDALLLADDRYSPESIWVQPQFSKDRVSSLAPWRKLAVHLKRDRRYVVDRNSIHDLEEVQRLVQHASVYVRRKLVQGVDYFRARKGYIGADETLDDMLSGAQRPFEREEIGAPPKALTLHGGRINPPGFSFLHLASDRDTAVAETRPDKGDVVSTAVFRTTQEMTVADLANVPDLASPFQSGDLLRDTESRGLMKLLNHEFALPVSPDLGPVEYVPTQYAAELLRDVGFDGVVYSSSLGTGENLVLFRPTSAQWVASALAKVEDVICVITSADEVLVKNMFEAAAQEHADAERGEE